MKKILLLLSISLSFNSFAYNLEDVDNYLWGRNGVDVDKEKALSIITELAKTDYRAKLRLGNLYYTGLDIDKDIQKAHDIYQELSKKGSNTSKFNLALIYHQGQGNFEKDPKKAVAWALAANASGFSPHLEIFQESFNALSEKELEEAYALAKKYNQ